MEPQHVKEKIHYEINNHRNKLPENISNLTICVINEELFKSYKIFHLFHNK